MSCRFVLPALALVLTATITRAQASGGASPVPTGGGLQPGTPGQGDEVARPGGGTFFWDRNRQGRAGELHVVEMTWGRLVDVHGLDAGGAIDPEPVFRDFLVGADVQSDGANYHLLAGLTTLVDRLVILRAHGTPEFAALLEQASSSVAVVLPRSPFDPPFTLVPRNAAWMLRFDDLLDDGTAARANLVSTVKVLTLGHGPETPFSARIVFDENHGGLVQGAFHSTRVLVDPAVSELEAGEFPVPLPVNAVGLPESVEASAAASVLLRLPTKVDPGVGQFVVLTNLRGKALATTGNGPVDLGSPTEDVVRAVRAGNDDEPYSGFLVDLVPPRLLGRFPVRVDAAVDDPAGRSGFSFLVDWTFLTPCFGRPIAGDSLVTGGSTLEVLQNGPAPSPAGQVTGVRVRLAQHTATTAGALLGNALVATPFRSSALRTACWFGILPQPLTPPADGVSTSAQFMAHFSEPMREESVDPYDAFRLVRGPAGQPADATSLVLADLLSSAEANAFALSPLLPLEHVLGQATPYHLELVGGAPGPHDLAGNLMAAVPAAADLRVDPLEATQDNGSLVLRFTGVDEVALAGAPDLRGQLFYDLQRGTIRGRPVTFFDAPVDRTNPVPSIMIPFPPGVQTPLNPLGSKLHAVWRYCDAGWNVRDETKYDVDVVGLAWAPVGGSVIADFYPEFEIRLAHSRFLPDESLDAFLLPRWPFSGLVGNPNLFTDNLLVDPRSPQKVVHPRALGYSVDPADAFLSSTGTVMLPYPLNEGSGPLQSYTWRDTAVLAEAGPNNAGIPMDIEEGPPLFLEPQKGTIAGPGQVPSIGLSLLLEYRCYPTDRGLGLNALDVSLAINSSALPAFRAYSSGGFNTMGQPVVVNPDAENVPMGGFNPNSSPPGRRTRPIDDLFYIGQLDLVYRVSRVHSVWLDTATAAPDYAVLQLGDVLPGSSSVAVELRGAVGFSSANTAPFDAASLDAYGDQVLAVPIGIGAWSPQLDDADGARYVQLRLAFVNDLAAGATPELDWLGLAFSR